MRKILPILLLLALSWSAGAQFYTAGTDPGYLRWYSIESPYYKIIYPQGADSLARSYARLMEQFRVPVGRSIGQTPQAGRWNRKFPVVLHTHHLVTNGSVGYAPARMDLFTTPEAYGGDPVSWNIQLAAHEPRHQAQLEKMERSGLTKGLSYLVGQGGAPLGWALYLSSVRGEGDAVAVETGLTSGTRARTADFLNYMQVAFDQGDWRNLTRWSRGSYKYYAPDYYKAGYVLVAGTRYLYHNPSYISEGMALAVKKPWLFSSFNYDRIVKGYSGKKAEKSFRDVMGAFNDVWQADAAARAPFLELSEVTRAEAFPLTYSSLCNAEGTLYALRSGYLRTPELVTIEGGQVKAVRTFASRASRLSIDAPHRRLYWSEVLPHPRWDLSGSSVVRYLDLSSGKTRDLTRGTRYFNPKPSPDGLTLAVAEYAVDGSTFLALLSAVDGLVLKRFAAPEGIQLTESAWLGNQVYCAGISHGGYGIYRVSAQGEWEEVLEPSHQKLVNLEEVDGGLEWVSDRTGVNELYRYLPAEGRLLQLSSTRYGATDFCHAGDTLYCVSQTRQGKLVFSLPSASLAAREVRFQDLHTYPIEDAITAQERALGPGPDFSQEVTLSAPKRYYKLAHPMQLHAWLPFYANADAIMNGSGDFSYQTLAPGATGFFQNTLGTLMGQAGFALHRDPDKAQGWRGALHAKFTYTGQYPVIEAQIDYGDRQARQYSYNQIQSGNKVTHTYTSGLRGVPLLSGSLKAYVPFASRKSGLLYGFIPQVSYSFANNIYSLDPVKYVQPADSSAMYRLEEVGSNGHNVMMQRLTASARAYIMLPRAHSQIYPRCGLGLEAGYSVRPVASVNFRPSVYGYAYAYLPGLWRTQGLKLTGTIQQQLGEAIFGESTVNMVPRGFSASGISAYLASHYRMQWKATADYAIPIFVGDLCIPMIGYIRNFVLTPHADYLGLDKDNLWSAGADLVANMGELFIMSTDIRLGASFSYLGGSIYNKTEQVKPYSVSLIFSFDF